MTVPLGTSNEIRRIQRYSMTEFNPLWICLSPLLIQSLSINLFDSKIILILTHSWVLHNTVLHFYPSLYPKLCQMTSEFSMVYEENYK